MVQSVSIFDVAGVTMAALWEQGESDVLFKRVLNGPCYKSDELLVVPIKVGFHSDLIAIVFARLPSLD